MRLGYRIGWHYDTDADGTVENNTDDPWYLFVYDERWRILNTYRLLDWAYNASNPAASYAKERFVYHNAGLGGMGGSSYIDSVMLRDRDTNTAWNAASDGTMEERVYYAQNFRHDVSALITSAGQMVEWIKYSSYGVPWSMPTGDTDSDGDFDATDASAITGTYDVRKDVNLDGTVDVVDFLDALDLNAGYVNQGWSKLGLTKWGNRKGYAGYEGDTALAGTKWHVRHRVLESELGRWMRRDPAGYVDGSSLFSYVRHQPIINIDTYGMECGGVIVPRSKSSHCNPSPDPTDPCSFPGAGPFMDMRCSLWSRCILTQAGLTGRDPCFSSTMNIGEACCMNGGNYERCTAEMAAHLSGCLPGDPCFTAPPQPPNTTWCNATYGICDSYLGANARCFCKCGGDGDWTNFVRACLACMHNNGVAPHTAHIKCYAEATKRYPNAHPPFMAACFAKCVAVQLIRCPAPPPPPPPAPAPAPGVPGNPEN